MSDKKFGTIFQIGDCLISEDVVAEYFSCDYEKCKGCCCIIGDSGAPLEDAEAENLEKEYASYSGLMRPEGIETVKRKGFFEIDRDGDIVTPLVEGGGECAFCHFDGDDNCLCSVERAYIAGKCRFRKPISCWLYPIRVTRLSNGTYALNLHRWEICKDAYEKGRREKVRVYQFLREPLIEMFGAEFYSALSIAASRFNADS